ncbi:1-acyl-sn-glycerol-3-phosphate acyltransferase [Rhodopseudomonas sp. HC1]|uniref:lysophospholipid acyltransferase family protein n=1 Tax=Rhodopseudomonas infernalis TaxID=2897386 RepID=UPI001EE8D5EA|nr:lysophospholipid acyltransferase family protein [Rhodopseudomonas infernalis]MCG6206992.1 1-acyl-sn-glycerol-3-phosphate acyltransferase [Rhodopseudomonas infernalis]
MIRFVLVIACIVPLTLALLPVHLLALRYGWRIQRSIPQMYHRIACRLIGVRIRQVGRRDNTGAVLILSNHVSWLDICVISAMAPVSFVAKSEVATWPVFGWLAKLQRTVFIDRQARQRTGEATAEIGARLASGEAIVLFAEGTSSDGSRVLPFRSALVGAVHHTLGDDTSMPVGVQPMAVTYTGFGGLPIGRELRERVAWYGDAELIPHFIGLLSAGAIDVTVSWGEPIRASDRKAITRQAEASVRRMSEAARRAGVQGAMAPRPETTAAPQSEPQFEPA